jgi:hypothetical protein
MTDAVALRVCTNKRHRVDFAVSGPCPVRGQDRKYLATFARVAG